MSPYERPGRDLNPGPMADHHRFLARLNYRDNKIIFKKWACWDSNPKPPHCKWGVLPIGTTRP